jgi:zinc protease
MMKVGLQVSRGVLATLSALTLAAVTSQAAAAPRARSRPAAPPPVAKVAPSKIAYETFTLPNGLTTIVYTDRSVPTVFVGLWYRVGSKDEPVGKAGFAHLFEHMMFQPTQNRSVDFFLPLNKAGATDINGMTTTDWTKYHETVPTNAVDLALWMESDRMGYLAGGITQEWLDAQRNVVKNEKRQGEARPGVLGTERYLKNYYPAGHPYAHTTIGSIEDLDKASIEDVRTWFTQYYGASNAVLVLSGDIDVATAREKVSRYFGSIRPGRGIDNYAQWVPSITSIKRDVLYDTVPAGSITRSWPLTNDDQRNLALLMLAGKSMAGVDDAFLKRRLVDELKVATEVSADVSTHQLSSSFDITMELVPGVAADRAGRALDETLVEFFRKGVPAETLQSIVRSTDISTLRSMESAAAVGMQLGQNFIDHGDPLFIDRQRAWIGAATPAEIIARARTVLRSPYYEMQILPLPGAGAAVADVDRTRMPEPGPATGTIKFPPITETTLENGLRIVLLERHTLPVVDVSLQFASGSLADRTYGPGTARNAFQLLSRGTTTRSADALRLETARLGATIATNPGGRQSSVSWSMLKSVADETFALVSDMIRHPAYPNAAIDAENAKSATGVRQVLPSAQGMMAPIFQRALWGAGHPAGKIIQPGDIPPVSRNAILRFHDAEIGPNTATMFIAGDLTIEAARALARKHFGDWKRVTPTPIEALPPADSLGARIFLIDTPGAAQSSIMVGNLVAPYDKDQGAAETLADAGLASGFSARINQNLREAKGWSYGFQGAVGNAPVGQRVFAASGSVETSKTAESITEIRREIRDYVTSNPITQAEMDGAKATMMRALPAGFASNAGFLSSVITAHASGLPLDRAKGAIARLSAVTLDDVRQAAARNYRPDDLVWVVAGDLRVIEPGIRALGFAPVDVLNTSGKRIR